MHCQHQIVDGYIHQLTFYDESHLAVDECMDHLRRIYEQHTGNGPLYLLFVPQMDGLPPFGYLLRMGQGFRREMARSKALPMVYSAVVVANNLAANMANTLLTMLGESDLVTRQIFTTPQDGLTWLRHHASGVS